MSKIVITGTGRCGTSFLIQLLTSLGFNTGYTSDECKQTLSAGRCDGGIEHALGTDRLKNSDIIKSPRFMREFEDLIKEVEIKHLIICIRNRFSVAESRYFQTNNKENPDSFGGMIGGKTREEEMNFNSNKFFDMMEIISLNYIPFSLINFPEMIFDTEYLYNKLSRILKINKKEFLSKHKEIANFDKIRF